MLYKNSVILSVCFLWVVICPNYSYGFNPAFHGHSFHHHQHHVTLLKSILGDLLGGSNFREFDDKYSEELLASTDSEAQSLSEDSDDLESLSEDSDDQKSRVYF